MNLTSAPRPASESTKLGTFAGVFMPSFLTIMGVIVFLRMGYVVGNAGLLQGLAIVLLANALSILTSLSVSAIATNIKVKGGGVYYLISRSLGVEFGGPIGLVLFLSQSISVSFYVIGFTEIFITAIPFLEPIELPIRLFILIGLFSLAYRDIDWATKVQFWILVALALGLVSYFIGGFLNFDGSRFSSNLGSDYQYPHSFWTIFAIYFPAITGFTQGVSLSGDLKSPEKSIPTGTLAAVGLSLVIYVIFAILAAGAATRDMLLTDYLVANQFALIPMLITVGVVSATLSSGLTSFLGAPRIMQALARDKIFPPLRMFAKGDGPSLTPKRATLLTLAVSGAGVFINDLNTIAPIVTMFFLITYGLMNYATFVEDFGNNPSFRPRFKWFHWRLSFAGAVGCLLAMLFIHTLAAVASILFVMGIYALIDRMVLETNWGDAQRGFYFSKIKDNLLRLRTRPLHSKNWRPQMLVLCGKPENRLPLIRIGTWLEAGHGLLTLANIIPGALSDKLEEKKKEEDSIRGLIGDHKLPVFWEVMVSPGYLVGVQDLVQCHSIGGIKPNTVVMGWSDRKEKQFDFLNVLQMLDELKKNIVIIKAAENLFKNVPAGIQEMMDLDLDVWWRGERNGAMMLLLAQLWTENPNCRIGRIRLVQIAPNEEEAAQSRENLNKLLESARIEAQVHVVISGKPWSDVVAEESKNADAVFIGLTVPAKGGEDAFLSLYEPLLSRLPTTIMVHSVEELDIRF